jgi:hypothetical protein
MTFPRGEEKPLGGYAVLLATYASLGAGLVFVERKRRASIRLSDVGLMILATHKLARLAAKDRVTSPLRAPFVKSADTDGDGKLEEISRGRGLRKALGDLVTCPYCMGPWIAGALVAAHVAAPQATRMLTTVFAVVAGADMLHQAYQRLSVQDTPQSKSAKTVPEPIGRFRRAH